MIRIAELTKRLGQFTTEMQALDGKESKPRTQVDFVEWLENKQTEEMIAMREVKQDVE